MTTRVLAAEEETPNFLLPNATIFVEFVLFLVVLFVLHRFVVPKLRRALDEREAMLGKQVEDKQRAARTLQQAKERYEAELAQARAQATGIRDQARADAARVRADLKAQADQEVERIQREGAKQLADQRDQALVQLRNELDGLSTRLAEQIVGQSLSDDRRRQSTVDQFLAELEHTTSGGGPADGHPSR